MTSWGQQNVEGMALAIEYKKPLIEKLLIATKKEAFDRKAIISICQTVILNRLCMQKVKMRSRS